MSKRDKENEEPTNDSRADRAMQLLWMYADGTGQRVAGQYTDELATIVQDALSDLMHYCDREELEYFDIQTKAFRRYREELKILPRHSRNPKTTTEVEQLPTSGRQGTTATPPDRFTVCAGWDFERINTKKKMLKALELPLEFATSGWGDLPEEVRQQLLGVPSNTQTLSTISPLPDHGDNHGRTEAQALAGAEPSFPYLISVVENNERTQFRACLTRNQHTAITTKLQELQDADDIDSYRVDDEEGGSYLTFNEMADTIHDTYSCGQQPDQIVSDRTAQHYTDPARD